MNEGLHRDGPDWDTLARAWRELGLGELEIMEPNAGLLEIRVSGRAPSAVSRGTVRELLRGILSDLAARPVGIAEAPEDDPSHASSRYLVGSPRLLARIGPDYESGVDAGMLIAGVSS
ncbi:MAG: hypothetical protein M8872_12845 [marine benthic group bacterium]|nr:hypothetical protein [Gemmatimonadota bacterium]